MGLLREWFWKMTEDRVVMPPTVTHEELAQGVKVVTEIIAENRRKEEEAIRHAAEARQRKSDVPVSHDNVRFSVRIATRYSIAGGHGDLDIDRISKCRAAAGRACPPNLHAAVLSFSARLVKYVRERCNGKAPVAYRRAGIDRKVYSRIVSSDWSTVSKQTALQFVIGLQLNRKEADEFLHAAGYALSPTIPMDCAFAHCIDHGIWNILDVNRIIVDAGLPELNIRF